VAALKEGNDSRKRKEEGKKERKKKGKETKKEGNGMELSRI
jgi:hypothetical protein